MGVFRFELEAVLRQRLAREREQQREVAVLERERLELEALIRACQMRIGEEKRDLAERLDGARLGEPVDLGGVRVQANASLRLIAEAQRAVLQLAALHERIGRARLELVERSIARRAMEALRERRLEAWKAGQRVAEAASEDELTVTRHRPREDAA